MKEKVLVAMSGGVDSSVAAYLLKESGYQVTGITMKLCGDSVGVEPAASVADKLGIDFTTVDYRDDFQKFVVKPFIEAYENGKTPNPCVECNRCIKFGKLIDDNVEGFEDNSVELLINDRNKELEYTGVELPMLATGHYAVIEQGIAFVNGARNNAQPSNEVSMSSVKHYGVENQNIPATRMLLRKSSNLAKDQSYFLYSLDQKTLARTLFPLGNLDKEGVRRIAEEQGFVNAHSKDSQDICFIPDGDYAEFIQGYTGRNYPQGNFVDLDGNILGTHKGIINYTLGQRKGLGLSLKKPMYVYRLDMERNEVILADNEQLFSKELFAENFNWVSMAQPTEDFRALARIRYRHKEAPCTVSVQKNGLIKIVFDEAQRAITSGQSVVLYDIEGDQYVLGGGVIV